MISSSPLIFRFWCNEHQFVPFGFGEAIQEVYFNQHDQLGRSCPLCFKSRPMTIEQYIGRNDANDTMIFAGDIVKTSKHDRLCEVEWTDDLCQWSLTSRVYDGGPDDYWLDGDFVDPDAILEVVGNKHQNPELAI